MLFIHTAVIINAAHSTGSGNGMGGNGMDVQGKDNVSIQHSTIAIAMHIVMIVCVCIYACMYLCVCIRVCVYAWMGLCVAMCTYVST